MNLTDNSLRQEEHTLRLQVLLAHFGIASRRHAADLIREGRVSVDGIVATEPGMRVRPDGAGVSVDETPLSSDPPPRRRTILLNKPRGLICSADEEQGPTVFECLRDIPERLVPVGRLDKDSEGLLLLSNDGEFVHTLTHPRYGHRKEYLVTIRGTLNDEVLTVLNSPMTLEDGTELRPVGVDYVDGEPNRDPPRYRLLMTLGEGRNRQIRRMCDQVGLHVERLIRLAIDDLRLPREVQVGEWRDLTAHEYASLMR